MVGRRWSTPHTGTGAIRAIKRPLVPGALQPPPRLPPRTPHVSPSRRKLRQERARDKKGRRSLLLLRRLRQQHRDGAVKRGHTPRRRAEEVAAQRVRAGGVVIAASDDPANASGGDDTAGVKQRCRTLTVDYWLRKWRERRTSHPRGDTLPAATRRHREHNAEGAHTQVRHGRARRW
ncbi:hypothetical protein BU14_0141s0028 [Porphyra umbilicalis]|uniref:Uncharacterized protein n=1 Tax=Porphyra umbilicalis TaxID=2786 RepID=A0A1X6PA84_PORUM|nr:hypothetical protein BU14_0141s0028 [Porphyra umbilicalis]|eukprot:OSX77645.1 hypothetical protein BU14_0141s0028 [Porphyra umbilicalis]